MIVSPSRWFPFRLTGWSHIPVNPDSPEPRGRRGNSSENVLEDGVDHLLGEVRVGAVKHQAIYGREGGQGDCRRT
jgi:hypothetical protein